VSANAILLLMFGGLSVFMLTGLPIAFVLGGLSLLFTVTLWEPNAVIVLVLQIFDTMKSEALLAIPLFILMACILQRSGVIEDLYHAMALWFGRLKGGLAIGTVIICVVMAAMTGVVGAAVTAMGILALPEMLKRGYKPELALGTICASGTLGILIPPSVLTIVYAVTAQISIGQMLIAGLVPGLILASLYIGYILVIGWLRPEWVPLDPSFQPHAAAREAGRPQGSGVPVHADRVDSGFYLLRCGHANRVGCCGCSRGPGAGFAQAPPQDRLCCASRVWTRSRPRR
jgi:TRAP-type mannitol/chloroaromatic compound transport system permease large subunit